MNDEKIRINVINGNSKDSLAYKEHEGEEYNVIAIGGDISTIIPFWDPFLL